ncbi:germination protein GerYC [Paenibacillus sp. J31TS4]|uniref:Ger(x)C family spore germination protein n=1 Tax=Paenibacillus sp. J31TS4 TaxID=2807195 RepID=UPI001B2D7432|nr:Ger(x)C family spore germination protein [Paenibacillus sp. J31TS4]GIP38108.1 germination protein GerYC [Paenibacillus sp. J31TS4]
MRAVRRCLVLLVLCSLLVPLSGCAFRDIDKRFFVLAIGFDKSKEEGKAFRISFKLGLPTAQLQANQRTSQTISVDASSIPEAARLLKSKVDKELDFGHAKVYVFGEELARESIIVPLDWLTRRRDMQMVGFTALGSPTAEAVLRQKVAGERFPANALMLSFGDTGTTSPYIFTVYLYQMYRRTTEQGLDPYLPVIRPAGDHLEIDRVALFDKERLKLILNPHETEVLKQIISRRGSSGMNTNIETPTFSLSITEFRASYNIEESEPPTLKARIYLSGIAESSKAPKTKPFTQNWGELEEEAATVVRERVAALLKKLQRHKIDPIGFGLRYRATQHRGHAEWNDWVRIAPKLNYDIEVKVKLEGTGTLR